MSTVHSTAVLLIGLLTSMCAHASDPSRSIAQMNHRVYTSVDGLPATIQAIAQTPDGYLWVGAGSGLYRFDGVRFERFATDRLLSLNIVALGTTANGDLWIGYLDGGLSRLRGGTVVNYPPDAGGPAGAANKIREAPHGGGLWAHVDFQPWRFDGARWVRVPGDWTGGWQQDGGIWALESGRDGTVWAKDGAAVYYCRPGAARFVRAAGYVGGFMGFARDRDGRVWTSDTRAPGRMYAMPELAGVTDGAIPGPAYGAQVSHRIRGRIFLDRDGTLWNTTGQPGLLRVRSIRGSGADSGQVDEYFVRDGLSSNVIFGIYEDLEGNVWVATNLGLDRFRSANVVVDPQIPSTVSFYGITAIRAADSIYVHASTSNDVSSPTASFRGPLYRVSADGSVRRLIADMDGASALAPARDGSLWIGTKRGLRRLSAGRVIAEPMPRDIQASPVLAIAEDAAGVLWVSLHGHGVLARERGVWSRVPVRRDEPVGDVSILMSAADGALWGYYPDDRVLVRYTRGRVEQFSSASGPNVGAVQMIQPDARGVIIGGEYGFARHDGHGFHTLRAERAPVLSFTTGIVEADGSTWIASQAGILRFDTQALERTLAQPGAALPEYELFDREDGLPGGIQQDHEFNMALPGPDGRLWFVTDHGVAWIDPKRIHRNPLPPPVAIRSLTVGERTYTSPTTLDLAEGTSNLQIDYTALSFVEPSRVRFRYRLDGIDDDWVDPGTRRQAFYTQLGPGTYRFQVIASNDAGVWNRSGATLAFTIPPTFVQSIWFKVICVLAGAMLLWLLYLLRLRQVTTQIRGRLEERIQERERIARDLHDTLLQNLLSASLQLSLANSTIPADAPAKPLVETILQLLRRGVDEGRNAVRDLRTRRSEQDVLERVFAQIPQDLAADQKIEYRLLVEGTRRALRPLVREEVYRIGHEAVANAIRHSGASVVETVLEYGRNRFRMVVRDDGCGMDPEVARAGRPGHWGLSGMRERAEKICGHLKVLSGAGAGTEIDLSVPGSAAFEPSAIRPWAEWLRGFNRRREPE